MNMYVYGSRSIYDGGECVREGRVQFILNRLFILGELRGKSALVESIAKRLVEGVWLKVNL